MHIIGITITNTKAIILHTPSAFLLVIKQSSQYQH